VLTGVVWLSIGPVEVVMNKVMNLSVSYTAGKFLSSCTTGGLSGRVKLHGVSSMTEVRYCGTGARD
jgi:hypothetical protein